MNEKWMKNEGKWKFLVGGKWIKNKIRGLWMKNEWKMKENENS